MKPSGYLLTRKNGDKSGTAHHSSVDFWLGKDDHVQPMYSHEDVMKLLNAISLSLDAKMSIVIESVDLLNQQIKLTGEITHTKKVLSEKKGPRVAGAVTP